MPEDKNLLAKVQQDYKDWNNPRKRSAKEREKVEKERKIERDLKFGSFKKLVYSCLSVGVISIVLGTALTIKAVMWVKNFNNTREIKTRPLEIKVQTPAIWTETKEDKIEYVAVYADEDVKTALEHKEKIIKSSGDPTVAQKIMDKFGTHGPLALSIATAESGLRYDALGANSDKSVDVGVFQINYKRHKDKPECSFDKISTVDGNIDCAYTIFKQQGNFSAWVAYKSGAYLAFFDKTSK